jgi:transcriptional regulator with XRE-family HTH domain
MQVDLVKKIRDRLGVTRYGLARLLGLPTPSIDHLEESGKAIKIEVLAKLRRAADLTWDEVGDMIDEEVFAGEAKPKRKDRK